MSADASVDVFRPPTRLPDYSNFDLSSLEASPVSLETMLAVGDTAFRVCVWYPRVVDEESGLQEPGLCLVVDPSNQVSAQDEYAMMVRDTLSTRSISDAMRSRMERIGVFVHKTPLSRWSATYEMTLPPTPSVCAAVKDLFDAGEVFLQLAPPSIPNAPAEEIVTLLAAEEPDAHPTWIMANPNAPDAHDGTSISIDRARWRYRHDLWVHVPGVLGTQKPEVDGLVVRARASLLITDPKARLDAVVDVADFADGLIVFNRIPLDAGAKL